jgi:coenzyme F420-0:L-glutamate ligase/coenzyme F420-1:gamma-L-glutamate ligase
MPLTLSPIHGIPLIQSGSDLAALILRALAGEGIDLQSGDILVLAQKIVSKAEGRFVNLTEVIPSERACEIALQTEKDARFIELVLQESKAVLRTRLGTIITEHNQGFVCANAGIDHSNVQNLGGNAEDWVLLLPKNADQSATRIRDEIQQASGKQIGVLIIDTHGRAWRMGTVGASIGLAGMPGLVDMRGITDLFGYQLRVTQVAAADELAAAASLMMGQAAENIPVVHVRGFPYPLREGSLQELIRPKELDLFR